MKTKTVPRFYFTLFLSENKIKPFFSTIVEVLKPAVGKSKVGFSSHVGKFEAVLDTIGDERPSASFFMNNDDDDDDNISKSGTSILGLLKSRHNCNT